MIGDKDYIIKNETVEKWGEYTTGEYENMIFNGDHFFYQDDIGCVCDKIIKRVSC